MNLIASFFWLLLGGLITSILYIMAGLILCVTIIGIPFGIQLIKFGVFALMPFGRDITSNPNSGCLSTLFNIIWIVCGWWEIAAIHAVFGLICFITIVGIPFGVQHFKLAALSIAPFGRSF